MTQVGERVEAVEARARHDARRVQWIAMGLEEVVQRAVAAHWADGALESDLRLADIRARRRAMEVPFPPRHHARSTLSSSRRACP